MWAIFGCHLLVIIGLLARFEWARKCGLVLLIWAISTKLLSLFNQGLTWNRCIHTASLIFIAYGLWRKPDNGMVDDFADDDANDPNVDSNQDEEPIISLVHLRSQRRYLEAPVLANALSMAWGLQITGGDTNDEDNSDGYVAGDDAIFVVMVKKPTFAMFLVHNRDTSYFEDPSEVASKVPNLRFADIIRDHSSWLAIDLMQVGDSKLDEAEAYRMIGKAISALADSDVMAILCPQNNYFNLWSETLEHTLCGASPLDALREEIKAPVYGVPNDDTIENAIDEARRRWPEFVACFRSRKPDDDRFLVKAPFTGDNGNVEHMWLQVFGLEPEYVHGHLINDPFHTEKLKKGSQVEVSVTEVSDWICPDANDKPLGNFTHLAVQKAAQANRPS